MAAFKCSSFGPANRSALKPAVDPLLGETTVNIGRLEGGVADNVIAPWAEARLMARLVSPADEVEARLRSWAGNRATIEAGVTVPPVRLGTLPGFETSVAAYATDIPGSRYRLPAGAHTWEVDVFEGDNAGLVLAEIELGSEDEPFARPDWLGEEVSADPRYYNSNLVLRPFARW